MHGRGRQGRKRCDKPMSCVAMKPYATPAVRRNGFGIVSLIQAGDRRMTTVSQWTAIDPAELPAAVAAGGDEWFNVGRSGGIAGIASD